MTNGTAPTRRKDSLADVVEMLLDKGVVINADIAVSVGETELLGIELRAAIASFETAAQYGLEFPDGTDMERVRAASEQRELRKPPERGLSTRAGVGDPASDDDAAGTTASTVVDGETTDEEATATDDEEATATDDEEATATDDEEATATDDERAAESTAAETDRSDDR